MKMKMGSGSALTRDPSDVNAVHDAVEKAQDLRDQHGEHALHDITEYFAVFIIYLSHFYSILNCIELLLWKNQVQFTRNTGK
jgi:hypothetical protein